MVHDAVTGNMQFFEEDTKSQAVFPYSTLVQNNAGSAEGLRESSKEIVTISETLNNEFQHEEVQRNIIEAL